MSLIDFDKHFTEFLHAWLEENQDGIQNIEQVERMMPALYDRFASTPASWLNGLTPTGYFEAFDRAERLLALMESYLTSEVSLPDLLLMRITQLGLAAENALMDILLDTGRAQQSRMICIRLLQDLGSTRPMAAYIAWQQQREERDDLADFALESLEEMGETAVPYLLEALEEANDTGKEALLSVLSRYPGHPEVFEGLMRLFDALPERQAILAAYLGRLGDERALPVLIERANEDGLKYLDYIELRCAIEALGGDAPERSFDQDPEYDALMGLD
ncbi:MAG: HEAT repeat domain-containing protein [Christensenellales bacterium]